MREQSSLKCVACVLASLDGLFFMHNLHTSETNPWKLLVSFSQQKNVGTVYEIGAKLDFPFVCEKKKVIFSCVCERFLRRPRSLVEPMLGCALFETQGQLLSREERKKNSYISFFYTANFLPRC